MTQLIIDDVALPQTNGDQYRAYISELRQQVDMISGRRVTELRGNVWRIEYAYDYMGNAKMREILALLRSGRTLSVAFLPDSGNELLVSEFLVESLTPPVFAFDRYGEGIWHGFSFALREVKPRD